MKIKVVGLGAGGHAKVVLDILCTQKDYEVIAMLDPRSELIGTEIMGVPVIGNDYLLPQLKNNGVSHFFIGLGSIGDSGPRQRLFNLAQANMLQPVTAIHPGSFISRTAFLDKGITIMPGAIINAEAYIGSNVIINSGAIVEHECHIGDHVHIATGARLASTVHVGENAHIGAGATILQLLNVGENSVVGAGAVVTRDVPPGMTVVGCPAKILI